MRAEIATSLEEPKRPVLLLPAMDTVVVVVVEVEVVAIMTVTLLLVGR